MRFYRRNRRSLLVVLVMLACQTGHSQTFTDARSGSGQTLDYGRPSGLPHPSATPHEAFEEQLFEFLNSRKYQKLGWRKDKAIRDTGPYINQVYYGTHPVVRIFYSPEMIRWLVDGRQGRVPDGAMMIKEQYARPAIMHEGKSEEELWEALQAWTIMIKDSDGSHDGWYWSNPGKDGKPIDNHSYEKDFAYPHSGFGHYCIRCHSSTTSPGEFKEYTFASLRNIEGFPGEPIIFRVDDSWRLPPFRETPTEEEGEDTSNEDKIKKPIDSSHPGCSGGLGPTKCPTEYNPLFAKYYGALSRVTVKQVDKLPPVTHDWVWRTSADKADQQQFITSNQCMSCHAAMSNELGPSMFIHTTDYHEYGQPGRDYSPYAEWRWTPMGLAGRDPIFMAQMETELAIIAEEFSNEPEKAEDYAAKITQTCFRCHGAMGHHQYRHDNGGDAAGFGLQHMMSKNSLHDVPGKNTMANYGALARDGISCMVCHRMQKPEPIPGDTRPYLQQFLETSITGNITLGPPGQIYGPFKDDEIAPYSMEHGLGLKPQHSDFIKSSRLCGSCHTVNLPILDKPMHGPSNELSRAESIEGLRDFHHHVEQATYLEWLNSEYQDEFGEDNPNAQSCQDCHMSKDLHDPDRGISLDNLETRIANIQDTTYPDAENLASHEELNIRVRKEGFARHNFVGLNAFLVEMFNQFDEVLGVRKRDFMTGTEQIPDAINNFKMQAREKTADLEVTAKRLGPDKIEARVLVRNKTGHRFPSGVGFRRAFLELVVVDETKLQEGADNSQAIVWSSGRTNNLGIILDGNGRPLPSEFFAPDENGQPTKISHGMEIATQHYQQHHEVIDSQDQVQIYETLLWGTDHKFTTSFVHGCDTVKDNRLLPKGWSKEGPDPALTGYFLKATYPGPRAIEDPSYLDGSGEDETIYQIQLPPGVDTSKLVVRARLFYQSIPPYFLRTIFETSNGPAAKRLHYLCSNLKLDGTILENWKLMVNSAATEVAP